MPARHTVLVAEPLGAAGADRLLADPEVEAVFADGQSRAELLDAIGGADALIVRSGTQADAELIAAGSGLRVIGRAGVGVDNIDLAAAAERQIKVVNTPEANTARRGRARLRADAGHGPARHRGAQLAGGWQLGPQTVRRCPARGRHAGPGRLRPDRAGRGPSGAGVRDGLADDGSVHSGRGGPRARRTDGRAARTARRVGLS